jgi:primosomal protein N'
MTDLLTEVQQFLKPSDSELFECRHCGCKLEEEAKECLSCGSEEVSRYGL